MAHQVRLTARLLADSLAQDALYQAIRAPQSPLSPAVRAAIADLAQVIAEQVTR